MTFKPTFHQPNESLRCVEQKKDTGKCHVCFFSTIAGPSVIITWDFTDSKNESDGYSVEILIPCSNRFFALTDH